MPALWLLQPRGELSGENTPALGVQGVEKVFDKLFFSWTNSPLLFLCAEKTAGMREVAAAISCPV